MEELGRLALESVADELKCPSDQKQGEGAGQEAVEKDAGEKERQGKKNRGNTQGVAQAVHGMLVTGAVLGDPLFAGASGGHARDDITIGGKETARLGRTMWQGPRLQ